MRVKVDENLPPEVVDVLVAAGHDATSVWDERLQGTTDSHLWEVCRAEGRCLLTLDIGFGDLRRYPPEQTPGIIVCRLARQNRSHVTAVIHRLVALLSVTQASGRLWIVTEDAVRVRGVAPEGTEG